MAKPIETLSIKLDFKDTVGTQQVIDKIKASFKGLGQVVSGNTKPAIQKLRNEINTFAATGNKSISTIESQVTALRALRREADINSREFKQLTADISKFEKQLGKAQGRRPGRGGRALAATQMAGAAISGGIFGGPEGFGGAVLGGIVGGVPGSFAGAAIGAQVGMIRQSLGGVAETVAEINSMKIALAGVSESAEDYRQSFNSVIEISKQFLFPVDRAIGEFTRLKAAVVGAGFGTKEATDVFKGFAAAILATGGNSEKLSGALLAASQVFSKGKVQAEELRGQIGERLPGAFTTFAQSIGVSSRDLDDMLRKGEVSTENFVEFTRTLFSRFEKTAETLGSSPEKAGQRLQLALSLATLEYGGFFQKVGAGFQDYLTNLVKFAVNNKETFKKVAANVAVFAQDVKDVVKGIVDLAKEAFGGLFTFLGNALKVFAQQFVMPFVNTILAAINEIANRVKLGQAERKLGGPFGRAGEIRLEELERYKKEEGITAPGRAGLSLAGADEIEKRAQQRILEEAGMGTKSRESRLSAALSSLDKAFAQFEPTKFATSLGDKPLPGGGDQNTKDGAKSTLARRIEQAQALEQRSEAQLRIGQAQSAIGRLLAQQDNQRVALQARINKLLADGSDKEIIRATEAAKTNQAKAHELELGKKIGALYKNAMRPLRSAVESIKDKIRFDGRYKELLKQGINPERAKAIISIEKAFEKTVELLNIEIDMLRIKVEANKASEREIALLDDLIKKRKEAEGERDEGIEATEGIGKKPTFMEGLDQAIKDQEDALKDLINPLHQVKEAANAIGEAFKTSFKGIITGSMTAREALRSFFQSIADHFADMAAQIAAEALKIAALKFVQMIVSSFAGAAGGGGGGASAVPSSAYGDFSVAGPSFFAKDGAYASGGFKAFNQGGVVSQPTLGMVGEGGEPEYIIPQSKMRESMSRYSRGVRGPGVIPSGSGASAASGGGTAVAAPIDVRYTVERINSVDYVTADQFQRGMQQAAAQGATQGEQRALTTLRQNTSQRRRIGL